MQINVTTLDIENARKNRKLTGNYIPSYNCPVAQALYRRLGKRLNLDHVAAGYGFIRVTSKDDYSADLMATPGTVGNRMLDWDRGGILAPFSFTVPDWRIEEVESDLKKLSTSTAWR